MSEQVRTRLTHALLTLLLTFVVLVFGEIAPKSIARMPWNQPMSISIRPAFSWPGHGAPPRCSTR